MCTCSSRYRDHCYAAAVLRKTKNFDPPPYEWAYTQNTHGRKGTPIRSNTHIHTHVWGIRMYTRDGMLEYTKYIESKHFRQNNKEKTHGKWQWTNCDMCNICIHTFDNSVNAARCCGFYFILTRIGIPFSRLIVKIKTNENAIILFGGFLLNDSKIWIFSFHNLFCLFLSIYHQLQI